MPEPEPAPAPEREPAPATGLTYASGRGRLDPDSRDPLYDVADEDDRSLFAQGIVLAVLVLVFVVLFVVSRLMR